MQGIVIFGGGTPTGDFGNSEVQTASSGSVGLSNSGETIEVKDGSSNTLIYYEYGGASDQSETRSPDLTGDFADHSSADTDDASLFSPGTRIDGSTFQPTVEISGNAGWRMLSLPVEDGTVEDISDDTAVQGVTGGDNAGETSNFYINTASDGSAQNGYMVPTNVTTPWGDGRGFILYFYDNTTAGSSELPITLEAFGTEPSGDVSVTVSNSWALLGNPFNSNFELDELTGNDSGQGVNNGLKSPVSVWDDGAGTDESGSWITANFGSGNNEILSTWQGFFIERNSSSTTEITFPEAGKTSTTSTVASFSKENSDQFREVELLLEAPGNLSDRSNKLYFTNKAVEGRDAFDGGKLTPLNGSPYLSFVNNFGSGDELYVQDSRPVQPERDQVYELALADAGLSGTYTLSWPEMKNIPSDWTFTLTDFETGETVNMIPGESYEFTVEAKQKAPHASVLNLTAVEAAPEEVSARFGIRMSSSVTTSNERGTTPEQFSLEQNYPNPFNPATNIQYSIAETCFVKLTVYNVMGQRVATIVNETKSAGTYRASWDASNMASGIYHYRLQAGNQVFTKQMTLIK